MSPHLWAPTIPHPGWSTVVLGSGRLFAMGPDWCTVAMAALLAELRHEQAGSNPDLREPPGLTLGDGVTSAAALMGGGT